MISKEKYDYIICGAGASGLLLSNSMINDDFFNDKKILIIEKDKKNKNDRTFGFWENKKSLLDELVFKEWEYAEFKDSSFHNSFLLEPFKYKMIKSSKFYSHIGKKISKASNFTYLNSNIKSIDQENKLVKTDDGNFQSSVIFSSIYDDQKLDFKKYPLLKQHFIGWTIETKDQCFDDNKITFMDFSVDQQNEIRFMYILPFSKNKALVEYTLFSSSTIEDHEYETEIKNYLKINKILDYNVLEKEKGVIPMTCYPFFKKNTDSYFKNRFWYYVLLFFDVLIDSKRKGSKVFSDLFKNNNPIKIFKFLDERTSFAEELSIFLSVNVIVFVKSLINRISNFSI